MTAVTTTRAGLRVPIVLSTLLGFASISTDLYLPALPAMAAALHADAGTVELTIAGYLVGFSAGQLLWGPIGDRYGRRGPVAAGLVLFVIGSASCALSAGAGQMIGWRVVQAVGACAGVVLARAMVRDLYPRDRAAQMLSTLMTIVPLLGPILGGQILALAGWRAIFLTPEGCVDPDRAGEILLRPLGRGLRAAALDVHGSSSSVAADKMAAASMRE